jgi:hypothetical protein
MRQLVFSILSINGSIDACKAFDLFWLIGFKAVLKLKAYLKKKKKFKKKSKKKIKTTTSPVGGCGVCWKLFRGRCLPHL